MELMSVSVKVGTIPVRTLPTSWTLVWKTMIDSTAKVRQSSREPMQRPDWTPKFEMSGGTCASHRVAEDTLLLRRQSSQHRKH